MRKLRGFAVVAVLTMVGTGACAFGPQREAGSGGIQQVDNAAAATGASATPGPGQSALPSPTVPSPSAFLPPAPTPIKSTKPPAKSPSTSCPKGDRQRETEKYLAQLGKFGPVTVDGIQSDADCAAIKKFQRRYGISPASGRAGPTTADVARRLATTNTGQCRTGTGTTICVNLTLQTVWAMRDGKVLMAPTITRTGMPGYATPTGTFSIGWRNIREWSNPYEVWMPYWQQFNGGIGLHQTVSYIHNKSAGSHGCVNLLPVDAQKLWEIGKVGMRVHVFGRRPGT